MKALRKIKIALSCLKNIFAYMMKIYCGNHAENEKEMRKMRSRCVGEILRTADIEVEVIGRENLALAKPCIFIANHQSYLDATILCHLFADDTKFLAKAYVFRIPLLGKCMKFEGHIPVYPKNTPRPDIQQLIAKELQNHCSVIVFPEGTRRKNDKMGPFRRGAFVAAIKNQVPVVPVAIFDTEKLLPVGSLAPEAGKCVICIEKPVEPPKIRDNGDISDDVAEFTLYCRNLMSGILSRKP